MEQSGRGEGWDPQGRARVWEAIGAVVLALAMLGGLYLLSLSL